MANFKTRQMKESIEVLERHIIKIYDERSYTFGSPDRKNKLNKEIKKW